MMQLGILQKRDLLILTVSNLFKQEKFAITSMKRDSLLHVIRYYAVCVASQFISYIHEACRLENRGVPESMIMSEILSLSTKKHQTESLYILDGWQLQIFRVLFLTNRFKVFVFVKGIFSLVMVLLLQNSFPQKDIMLIECLQVKFIFYMMN